MTYLDLGGYLISKFKAEFKSNNYQFACPMCNDTKEHMGADLKKGVVHCFKCGYANTTLKFIMEIESVNFTEAYRIIAKYGKVTHLKGHRAESGVPRFKSKAIGYVSLRKMDKKSPTRSLAMIYLFSRGITSGIVYNYRLGVSTREDLLGRVIVPCFENRKFVYYVARKFMGSGPKYKNPSRENFEMGKKDVLFNIDGAARSSKVVIVEGVFDAMAVGANAVAILGSKISNEQVLKLLEVNPKEISVYLDADAPDKAYEVASRFDSLIPTRVIETKNGDPGSHKVTAHQMRGEKCSLTSRIIQKLDNAKHQSYLDR